MEVYILIIVKIAVGLIVFSLGLNSSPSEAISLIRKPKLLLKSIISMNIIMPLFAVAMIFLFDLTPAVEIALFTLAVSPIPPLLPNKAFKAGGDKAYTVSLLLLMASLSILFVPLSIELLGFFMGREFHVPAMPIINIVGTTILIPLAAGLLIRKFSESTANRLLKPVTMIAIVCLILGVIPILIKTFPGIISLIGNGTVISLILFTVVGLISGQLLGGPEYDNRTVLALTTSSRHPGIAIIAAMTLFPEQKLAIAAIALYLLLNIIISLIYIKWRKRA